MCWRINQFVEKRIDKWSVRFTFLSLENIKVANFKIIRAKVETCSQLWWTVPLQQNTQSAGIHLCIEGRKRVNHPKTSYSSYSIPTDWGGEDVCVSSPGLTGQPAPAPASPSHAAAEPNSACSAPAGPPATAAEGRSPLTSGCRGSWWTPSRCGSWWRGPGVPGCGSCDRCPAPPDTGSGAAPRPIPNRPYRWHLGGQRGRGSPPARTRSPSAPARTGSRCTGPDLSSCSCPQWSRRRSGPRSTGPASDTWPGSSRPRGRATRWCEGGSGTSPPPSWAGPCAPPAAQPRWRPLIAAPGRSPPGPSSCPSAGGWWRSGCGRCEWFPPPRCTDPSPLLFLCLKHGSCTPGRRRTPGAPRSPPWFHPLSGADGAKTQTAELLFRIQTRRSKTFRQVQATTEGSGWRIIPLRQPHFLCLPLLIVFI